MLNLSQLPPFSVLNGFRFGPQPEFFAQMSIMEKNLVSPVIPFVKIIKLSGGQTSTRGTVINYYNRHHLFTQNLPRHVNQSGIIKVKSNYHDAQAEKIWTVRPKLLLDALIWFKENNPLFEDVNIDMDYIRVCRLFEFSSFPIPPSLRISHLIT